jgi:hypothetical protein
MRTRSDPNEPDQPVDLGDVLLDELREIRGRRRDLGALLALDSSDQPRPPQDSRTLESKLDAHADGVRRLGDVSALCLSGGGIRSAAFALGVVQGLAARGLLPRFDYLSTVSGGGYLGGFLTAWVQRRGYDAVIRDLQGVAGHNHDGASPLQHLRRYSSYLTPHKGWLSADTLTVVALYLRNLALNWSILLPLLVAALLVVKAVAVLFWIIPATPAWISVLGLVALMAIGFAAVESLRQRPGWEDVDSGVAQFAKWEMAPTMLGAVAASCAALKFAASAIAGIATLLPLALIGAAAAFIVWMSTFVLSRPRDSNASSTDATIRTVGWLRRAWDLSVFRAAGGRAVSLAAFMAAGACVGLIFGVLPTIACSGPATDAACDTRGFTLLILGPPAVIVALFVSELVYFALTDGLPWSEMEREWLARASGYHSRMIGVWIAVGALVFGGSWTILEVNWVLDLHPSILLSGLGATAGVLTAFLGKAPATDAIARRPRVSWRRRLPSIALALVTAVFVTITVILLSAAIDWQLIGKALRPSVVADVADGAFLFKMSGSLILFVLVGFLASWLININRCSLHGMYRNRLIRAFLGASNAQRGRRANKFIDFDEQDNLDLAALWPNAKPVVWTDRAPGAGEPSAAKPSAGTPPQLLVINCALNVVASQELDWQERKALSFTATPQWVGCGDMVGPGSPPRRGCFRDTSFYGKGITLGTAMTISGAAASPNMGYHSSPGLSVLLTLLNVRLGAWLGNPGPAGARTYKHEGPRFAAVPLIQEALGMTTEDRAYAYLSDGGHFENLGLYEMVRRRCRFIVVSDGGCDPDCAFEDLGNAVRRVAIDLKVKIDFRALKIGARQTPPVRGPYCAVATIIYDRNRREDDGLLLYLKPGYQGLEPASVRSYAAANPAFPHESTTDQLFGESQFEAYRALGEYVMQTIDGGRQAAYPAIKDFINAVAAELGREDVAAGAAPSPKRRPSRRKNP